MNKSERIKKLEHTIECQQIMLLVADMRINKLVDELEELNHVHDHRTKVVEPCRTDS